jgi:hypothetical protein
MLGRGQGPLPDCNQHGTTFLPAILIATLRCLPSDLSAGDGLLVDIPVVITLAVVALIVVVVMRL